MNFLFLKYNNYFSRTIKKRDSLQAYVDEVNVDDEDRPYSVADGKEYNFNINDGIFTDLIYNWRDDNWLPDYLVCYEDSWQDDNIHSRWFITNIIKTRTKQYKFILKRDVIADNINDILESDAYIRKGNISLGNPLIYNKEGITVNQIKTEELPIYDSRFGTNVNFPWIGLYVDDKIENSDYSGVMYGVKYNYDGAENSPYHNIWDDLVENGSVDVVEKDSIRYITNALYKTPNTLKYNDTFYPASGNIVRDLEFLPGSSDYTYNIEAFTDDGLRLYTDKFSNLSKQMMYDNFTTNSSLPVMDIPFDPNKKDIIKIDNIYYVVTLENKVEINNEQWNNPSITEQLKPVYQAPHEYNRITDKKSTLYRSYTKYTIKLEEYYNQTNEDLAIYVNNLKKDSNTLLDAPYRLLFLPYADYIDAKLGKFISKKDSLSCAVAIATALGSSCKDIQILPYAPLQDGQLTVTKENGYPKIEINARQSSVWKTGTSERVLLMYWASYSTFNFRSNINTLLAPVTALETKIDNETRLYRLCSPNYQGLYEFSNAMNNGVDAWDIDITYKPFQSHIHVAPLYKNLYSQDFNDSRGLICSGDFSLPQITDQWVQYQLENKNYQLQFDRQIQSEELKLKESRTDAIINGITGTVTSALSGIAAGSLLNPIGSVAGGSLGAVTGAIDSVYNGIQQQKLGRDNINLQKEMFEYNLANIQARPTGLTNVGVLNYDFKYWPFLEIYKCTDKEEELLTNKIKYEGMTVNTIDKISNYTGDKVSPTDFLQATIIRYNPDGYYNGELRYNYGVTSEILNEINRELDAGIYYKGE